MEGLDPDLVSELEDAGPYPESDERSGDGWLKVYVECPECEVPMSRTTVKSEDIDDLNIAHSMSRSEHHAVCPECHEYATLLDVMRVTDKFDEIGEAFDYDDEP